MLTVKVVIKSVGNGRADGKFYIREQVLNSLCHYMRRSMADSVQTFFTFGHNKFYAGIMCQLIGQVFVLSIYNSKQSLLAKFLRKAFGNFKQGERLLATSSKVTLSSYSLTLPSFKVTLTIILPPE